MFENEEDAIRAAEWVRNNRDDPRAQQVIQMLREWDSGRQQSSQTAMGQTSRQGTPPQAVDPMEAPPALDEEGNWIGFEEESPQDKADRRVANTWKDVRQKILTPIGAGMTGLVGGGEVALTVGTGAAQAAAGGLVGLGTAFPALTSGVTYEDVAERANMAVEATLQEWVYMPKTVAGQTMLATIGGGMQDIDGYLMDSSEKLALGDPETATVIYTALNFLPTPTGVGARAATTRRIRQEVARVEDALADRGIYLGDPDIRQQIQGAAEEAVGTGRRGEHMSTLRDSLHEAEKLARAETDALYTTARAGDARIQSLRLRQLHDNAERIYNDFHPDTVPMVNTFLKEIESLIPPVRDARGRFLPVRDKFTNLRDLDNLRRQISNSMTKNKRDPQNRALRSLKGMLDEWLDKQFMNDVIQGDPQNLLEWKRARESWYNYNDRFNENRTIRQLMDEEASVEDLRKFLFGLSETGSKTQAAQVVIKLKEILGDDHAAVNGLRAEFMLDIFQPLLRKEDLKGFVDRYDRVLKNNPTLIHELGIPKSDLQLLINTARAVEKTGAGLSVFNSKIGDMPKVISRILLGNRLAKATLRQNLLANTLRAVWGRGDVSTNAILMELLGYDVGASIIPKGSRYAQMIIASELDEYVDEDGSLISGGGR